MAIGGVRIRVGSHCEGEKLPGRDFSGLPIRGRRSRSFMFAVCLGARDIPPSQTYIFDLTTEMLTSDVELTIDVKWSFIST